MKLMEAFMPLLPEKDIHTLRHDAAEDSEPNSLTSENITHEKDSSHDNEVFESLCWVGGHDTEYAYLRQLSANDLLKAFVIFSASRQVGHLSGYLSLLFKLEDDILPGLLDHQAVKEAVDSHIIIALNQGQADWHTVSSLRAFGQTHDLSGIRMAILDNADQAKNDPYAGKDYVLSLLMATEIPIVQVVAIHGPLGSFLQEGALYDFQQELRKKSVTDQTTLTAWIYNLTEKYGIEHDKILETVLQEVIRQFTDSSSVDLNINRARKILMACPDLRAALKSDPVRYLEAVDFESPVDLFTVRRFLEEENCLNSSARNYLRSKAIGIAAVDICSQGCGYAEFVMDRFYVSKEEMEPEVIRELNLGLERIKSSFGPGEEEDAKAVWPVFAELLLNAESLAVDGIKIFRQFAEENGQDALSVYGDIAARDPNSFIKMIIKQPDGFSEAERKDLAERAALAPKVIEGLVTICSLWLEGGSIDLTTWSLLDEEGQEVDTANADMGAMYALSQQAPSLLAGIRNLEPVGRKVILEFAVAAVARGNSPTAVAMIVPKLPADRSLHASLLENFAKISDIDPQNLESFLACLKAISESPVQELQRVKEPILAQLMHRKDPEQYLERILDVYQRNNLPYVAKAYLIFETLNGEQELQEKELFSPVLSEAKRHREILDICYKDLLRVHIESNNPSLKNYLQAFSETGHLFDMAEAGDFEEMTSEECEQFSFALNKADALAANRWRSRNRTWERTAALDSVGLERRYRQLRGAFGNPSTPLLESLRTRFLLPMGFDSASAALESMRGTMLAADFRSRELFWENFDEESGESCMALKEGDLLKGVASEYVSNYLENGIVAQEFLGASADSDSTPLDTDVAVAESTDTPDEFMVEVKGSIAYEYGDIILAVRNRGQFNVEGGYELFNSAYVGVSHYNVRTGFSSSEIDFLIVKEPDNLAIELDDLYLKIAKSGRYIPVTDGSGKVIFSPQVFDEYRKTFAGLQRFDAEEHNFPGYDEGSLQNYLNKDSLRILDMQLNRMEAACYKPEAVKLARAAERQIEACTFEILESMGIKLRSPFDAGIYGSGAELANIGSSGRGTNMPGPAGYDFDYSLKLDDKDFYNHVAVLEELKQYFAAPEEEPPIEDGSHGGYGDEKYFQIRLSKIRNVNGVSLKIILGTQADVSIDLDLGIAAKSDLTEYGSHTAVEEKLAAFSSESRPRVIANIVMAKQLLRDGNAYKRFEEGGMGGIGVEHWILHHNGSFAEAALSFMHAALGEDGTIKSFNEFADTYKIFGAGVNIKKRNHDNFVRNMRDEGYKAMVCVLSVWLSSVGCNWHQLIEVNKLSFSMTEPIAKDFSSASEDDEYEQFSDIANSFAGTGSKYIKEIY